MSHNEIGLVIGSENEILLKNLSEKGAIKSQKTVFASFCSEYSNEQQIDQSEKEKNLR